MKPPFHLVQETLSTDSVECLETLLQQARKGQLIGIAYVAMYKRREYTASACGEAMRNPTFTRGMIASLDDFLGDMVKQ